MEENIISNNFTLQVDNSNSPYLMEASKWGKFLSVLGFILIVILVICGFAAALSGYNFSSSDLNNEFQNLNVSAKAGGLILAIYFWVVSILYFFPCLFLYKFSAKMQFALRNNDQVSLNSSFHNLKSLFKFFGILTIIFLCMWILIIIFGVVLATAFSH